MRGDRSSTRFYLLLALAVLPLGLITNLAYLVGAWADGRPYNWTMAAWSMLSFACWALVSPVIIAAARRYRPIRSLDGPVVVFFVLLCVVLSVLVEVLFTIARWSIRAAIGEGHSTLFAEWRQVFGTTSMTLDVLLFAGTVAAVWAIEAARVARARAEMGAQLEARLAETRLQLLRMQLQPHFLFNALNAVSALVVSDPRGAALMLERLEEFFQFSLEREQQQEIPLSDEIEFLVSYVEIEKVRFGERLSVELEIDPRTRTLFVPSLILQPLVENAIRHGISGRMQHGRVVIRTSMRGDQLVIEVEDDGAGLPERGMREGVGIANTKKRMEQLYGREQLVVLDARPSGGVLVRLELPARVSPVMATRGRVA